MPQINEIRKARDLGRTTSNHSYIYTPCEICKRLRWVRIGRKKPLSSRCLACGNIGRSNEAGRIAKLGTKNPSWRGGRHLQTDGYIHICLQPDNFFYPMANSSHNVLEHRLVMAKHLNRCLLPWEIVHHKNGIKDDNRLNNLDLLPHGRFHIVDMHLKRYVKFLEKKVARLEGQLNEIYMVEHA